MTAAELKIGDTFKRQGFTYKVANLITDTQVNGTPIVIVECISNISSTIDSYFRFKFTTKIK
jgi:hypothetical protein